MKTNLVRILAVSAIAAVAGFAQQVDAAVCVLNREAACFKDGAGAAAAPPACGARLRKRPHLPRAVRVRPIELPSRGDLAGTWKQAESRNLAKVIHSS